LGVIFNKLQKLDFRLGNGNVIEFHDLARMPAFDFFGFGHDFMADGGHLGPVIFAQDGGHDIAAESRPGLI